MFISFCGKSCSVPLKFKSKLSVLLHFVEKCSSKDGIPAQYAPKPFTGTSSNIENCSAKHLGALSPSLYQVLALSILSSFGLSGFASTRCLFNFEPTSTNSISENFSTPITTLSVSLANLHLNHFLKSTHSTLELGR